MLTRHQLRQKDLSFEAALSSFVEAPRLAVLGSKTFNSDNKNEHLNKFITFANGIRTFSINSKKNLPFTFIICFLLGALIVGATLGLLCFYILRCLSKLSLDDDDAISLVNCTKNLNNSNYNFYKYNNENLSDKLSFSKLTIPPITKNNQIFAAYTGTLERCIKSDTANNNITHAFESVASNFSKSFDNNLIINSSTINLNNSTTQNLSLKNTNTNTNTPIPNTNFNQEMIKLNDNLFNISSMLPFKSVKTPTTDEKKLTKQVTNNLVSIMHASKLPTVNSLKDRHSKLPLIERQCLSNNTSLLRSPPSPSRIPRKLPEKLLLNLNK